MMRIRLLAVPALAALMLPAMSEAGGGLRGRIGSRSGQVISVTPIGTTNSTTATTKTPGAAAPAATPAPAPVKPVPPPVPGAPAVVGGPSCGPNGCADGSCGGQHRGLFSKLFGEGGCFAGYGDGKHGGCLANHPPEFGNGHHGFGFCQPPFQAAPWYLYWPYDAHFQLPAPIAAQYYPPPQTGNPYNPYFPGPGFGVSPAMGMGAGPGMMGPGMMPPYGPGAPGIMPHPPVGPGPR